MASDPAKADDAFRRRAKNVIGRSRRQGYRGDPIPENFGFSRGFEGEIDRSDESGAYEGFSGHRACTILGITYRQLDYWVRTGLIRPSVQEPGGRWRFSYDDLVGLKIFKHLLDAGISLQVARGAQEALREASEPLDDAALVLGVSGGPRIAHSGEELVALLRESRVLNILPLKAVFEELDAAIAHGGAVAPGRTEETRTGTA